MGEGEIRDAALTLDITLAARDALNFVEGLSETEFIDSRLHQNAVIRSLEVMGEAANKLSPSLRAAEPEIPWREIVTMRNRVIHGYSDVELDIVWTVLQDRLRPLIAVLKARFPEDR